MSIVYLSRIMAVTPSGKGRGNGKKPIWGGGARMRKGRREGGWDTISLNVVL
jgi:hypothetical protein